MIVKCPVCSRQMALLEHDNKNVHYFLCQVDKGTNPPNIKIDSGIAVDAYACTTCGTILLNSKDVIGLSTQNS